MAFEIPADIAALDDEKLAAALDAALSEAAEFDSIPDADLTDEHLARLSELAEFATLARETQAQRETAATERTEKIAAARAALLKPEEPEPAEEPAEEPAKEPVTAAAAINASPGGKAKEKVAVVGRTTPAAEVIPAPKPLITASADVPGFSNGGELAGLDEVGQALIARMKGLPTQRLGGSKGMRGQRYGAATINLNQVRTTELAQNASGGEDQGLLARARNTRRLAGGSLVAGGGWCAPSETLYDLCQIATTEGLLDLPTIQVNRGGIRFTRGPGFDTLYNDPNLGWWLTEAEIIAQDGTEDPPLKPCITVPCPDFEEVRLDAIGLCINVPLLTEAAYPELVRWTIENALIAHQHKVDAALIQKIVDGSTDLDVNGTFDTTIDSLAQVEQAANFIRQSWRMSFSAELEMLLPIWYRTTMRMDLARRTGVDLINVSDAQLAAYFTSRNISVQWLYNYQPLQRAGAGGAGAVETPEEVQAVIYPAGTWVKGTTDIITLDAVYDSTNLSLNQYTALFTEEGVLVANPCFDSYLLTLNTCASGRTGAADIVDCGLSEPAVTP